MSSSNHSPFLTRKEVADRLDMSVEFIRRNEARLGLHACRVTLSRRVIRYRRADAEAAILAIVATGAIRATNTG